MIRSSPVSPRRGESRDAAPPSGGARAGAKLRRAPRAGPALSAASLRRTMDRPPAPPPPSDPRDARPARRHDSEAETTSEPESSRGGMEAPADPQLLLNGAAKEAGRPSPGPPAAPVPVIELVRRGGSLDIKSREAAGEAMQRAPGAEPCRAAEAACEARMVQLSPPALPLQPPGRAMLYNLGQPLATINRSVCPLSHPQPGAVSRGVPSGVGAAGGEGWRCGGRSSGIPSSARDWSLKSSRVCTQTLQREKGKRRGESQKRNEKLVPRRKIICGSKVLGGAKGSSNNRMRTRLALPSSPGSLCSPRSPANERSDSKALTGLSQPGGVQGRTPPRLPGKAAVGGQSVHELAGMGGFCPNPQAWTTPLTSPCPQGWRLSLRVPGWPRVVSPHDPGLGFVSRDLTPRSRSSSASRPPWGSPPSRAGPGGVDVSSRPVHLSLQRVFRRAGLLLHVRQQPGEAETLSVRDGDHRR